jgi:hypothetical protein
MRNARIVKKTSTSASLYRLIYRSRNGTAITRANSAMERDIRAIVATARERNKADNVTGALVFSASGFAQVLEGPRDVVERTFERIAADPRHADVTVLSFTPAERRSFPDWPMGFIGQMSPNAADPLAPILVDAAFPGGRATTGSDVLRLLERLVQREDE